MPIIKHQIYCVICQAKANPLLDFPKLPLTDSYTRENISNPIMGIDQKLLYCEKCGHGQLEDLIDPVTLYGSNYCFRTSESTTARKGTEFFLSVIDDATRGRKFNCVLDLGCNDLFLLGLLKDKVQHRVGIDPVWRGREDERTDKDIKLFGMNFEDVDLDLLPQKPDLIVCRHTLEHIFEPVKVLQLLMKIASDDAVFIFEVPGFDGLIERIRFDQVFHQHAQYFSLASFLAMLNIVDGKYMFHRTNFHDWGAMAIAFQKQGVSQATQEIHWSSADIVRRYSLFQDQMKASGNMLSLNPNSKIYGYGAAQMLPVIGYHMGTDFSELIAVIDDDEAKDGAGYWNLPVKILSSKKVDSLTDATVVITAIDNVKPIALKLLEHRPRHIILPLTFF